MNIRRVTFVVLFAASLAACSTTTTKSVQSNTSTTTETDRRDTPPPDPRKRAAIRLQLAVNYYQDAKFSIALDELKQALAIDPTFADAHMLVAMVYTELNETARAEQSFARALQLEPNNPDVNNNYGWYLCQHGREKDSLVYFENALKDPLYPQKAKPLQNAGVCANKLGDPKLAEAYFSKSFEIDPGGNVSAFNLAQIFYERQDFTRARFYVARVNSSPAPSAASLWLGIRVERRLGNRNNQIALENQLERQFGDSREAQLQRRGSYGD
jgi:type IV pilus assembly protein PilF